MDSEYSCRMRKAGLKAQIGYKGRPGKYGTKPAIVANSHLKQDFAVTVPDTTWVTDITYIRTHEGWLYLAVVIYLYSRRVIGCSTKSRMQSTLGLDALLMAVWRRKPDIVSSSAQIKAHNIPAKSGELLKGSQSGAQCEPKG